MQNIRTKMKLGNETQISHCSIFHFPIFLCCSAKNKRKKEVSKPKKKTPLEYEIIVEYFILSSIRNSWVV